MSESVIELRQKDGRTIQIGEYENMLSREITINDGDTVLLKQAFIDTKKTNSNQILIEEDTIRVVSSSDGQSLLVLPFLFSNCVVVDKISTDNVIIQRANGFQLSFEFYKNLDLKIKYEYGLFKNSDCRLRDFIYNNQLSENKIPSLLFKFANSYYKKN